MMRRSLIWAALVCAVLLIPTPAAADPVSAAILGTISASLAASATAVAITTAVLTTIGSMVLTKLLTPGQKAQDRQASVTSISIGEGPREAIFGEVATGGSLADAFNYGGTDGTDWEVMIVDVADHRCHSLTGFYVSDVYVPFTGSGPVAGYNGQLEVYWLEGTETQTMPAIVTSHGGWDAGSNLAGCATVVVAYKADSPKAKRPIWTAGRPQFLWVVKGKYCYIPRLDSTVAGGTFECKGAGTYAVVSFDGSRTIDATASTTAGSNALTSVVPAVSFVIGSTVTGAGIPAGTTITDIGYGTAAMSANAAATGVGVALTQIVVTTGTVLKAPTMIRGTAGAMVAETGGAVGNAVEDRQSLTSRYPDEFLIVTMPTDADYTLTASWSAMVNYRLIRFDPPAAGLTALRTITITPRPGWRPILWNNTTQALLISAGTSQIYLYPGHRVQFVSTSTVMYPVGTGFYAPGFNAGSQGLFLGFDRIYIDPNGVLRKYTATNVKPNPTAATDGAVAGQIPANLLTNLPTTNLSVGQISFATNARALTEGGALEAPGAGTGASVTWGGAAWKITGTSIVASI